MSGSGGDTGYDYQADATAYVAAFGLAGQPLPWFEGYNDVPVAWAAETGGPGDDIKIITLENRTIEVQAKHGLVRNPEYVATFRRLVTGLRNSADLRCALIVDRHASAVIRSDLKHDIARLGQGRSDFLKAVTTELLADLEESPQTIGEVFARLQVIVVDLDEGSDGVSVAQSLLSRVVAPGKAIVSYDLLGKRYHRSIKRRSQDTVHSCARYLDGIVGLAASTNLPAVVTSRFAAHTLSITESFYSPALQARFQIENAWNRVVPLVKTPSSLKAQIERYQEWTRLTRNQSFDESVEAELFSETNLHAIIVGGPGSGKTTLSKKIAHDLSENTLVLWARLPVVSGLMAQGATFDAALARAAIDTSAFSEQDGRLIVASAELLVADGLDECDPNRASIAEAILRWTVSHPSARVCVLTRPVGHSPELLPGFNHAELVPLDKAGVRRVAELMISRKANDVEHSQLLRRFLSEIDEDQTVAAVAARNPLLLSFLVSLFVDGQPIAGSRAMLFSRIIEQIRKVVPRRQIALVKPVDYASAWRTAEIVGWSSIEKPDRSVVELYEFVGKKLASGLEGVRAAEAAIHEWMEHGLLERLTAGSLDAVVFVHLALGEHLAGRYLSQLPEDEFRAAITAFRNKAKWREPILLCAAAGAVERLITTLLDLDSPGDPNSMEAMLAAAALKETEPVSLSADLIERMVTNLKQRLSSAIPLVTIDAALSLLAISGAAPDSVAASGKEYWEHGQEWTRFAARCVAIGSRSKLIGATEIANWLDEFEARHSFTVGTHIPSVWPTGTHELQKTAMAAAVARIAYELPFEDAKLRIVKLLESNRISMGMSEAIENELRCGQFQPVFDEIRRKSLEPLLSQFQHMTEFHERSKRAEEKIMESLIIACGVARNAHVKCRCGYKSLGILFSSLGLWEATPGDFFLAAATEDSLVEVLRGWIAGLGLSPDALGQESNCLINCGNDLLKLPHLKRELNAEQVQSADLNVGLLGQAMQQQSWFLAVSAAKLFAATDSAHKSRVLDALLETGTGQALLLAGHLAKSVWGGEAFQKLLKRVSDPRGDKSGFLYAGLLECAGNPSELETAIITAVNAVRSNDPTEAVRAAEALFQCTADSLVTHKSEIKELFSHWETRGSRCDRCNKSVHGTSCDECHIVPPQPQKYLVALLAKTAALPFNELIELANRERFGVAEEARKALVELARTSPQHMKDLLAKVGSGAASQQVLDDILALPIDELRRIADQLQELLRCNSAPARARIVRSLTAGWLDSRDANVFAQSALSDESPQVRNSAATVLRELIQL